MKNTMAQAVITLGLSFLVLAPSSARAEVPPQVSIRSVVSGGTGCPSGNVHASLGADGQRLFLLNGSLSASAAPGIPLTEMRSFCQITIELDHTPGYSFAATSEFGHRGFVQLSSGVTATLEVERYFSGDLPGTPSLLATFHGPTGRRYFVEREPVGALSPFSPCGAPRALNIRTAVRVSALDNPAGVGSIQIAPMWGVDVLRLHWTRCR
jgi:hypothetical protein